MFANVKGSEQGSTGAGPQTEPWPAARCERRDRTADEGAPLGTLRWLTAGESHGPALVATLEGLPAGVPVTTAAVADALARRGSATGVVPG